MSESAWQLLMIILAPVVFVNLVLFGLLVRAAFEIRKEKKMRKLHLKAATFIMTVMIMTVPSSNIFAVSETEQF